MGVSTSHTALHYLVHCFLRDLWGIGISVLREYHLSVYKRGSGNGQNRRQGLSANGLSFLLFGFYTVYSSLFLALGKGKEGFILGACRQGICFVPFILLLPLFAGVSGILYAQPAADVISAVITVFMAIRLHRELGF